MGTKTVMFANGSMNYRIFICSGKGKNRRESGVYTELATNYLNAAKRFGDHSNVCSCSNKYGSDWKITGRKKGNPKSHSYLKDEKGNELLIIKANDGYKLKY